LLLEEEELVAYGLQLEVLEEAAQVLLA